MLNVGIICDLQYDRSIFFSSYYYAVKNIFGYVKIINNSNDLENINILFIGNDHFWNHRLVWENNNFIDSCNIRNIKVFVFTAERIITPHHPWNIDIQKNLEKFNNLYQYVIDVDDCIKLNKKITRGMISNHYKDCINVNFDKIDKCVFIGNVNGYPNRPGLISKLEKLIDIDIIQSSNCSWIDYMMNLSKYRFVLSPLSVSNSFSFKFYEILLVGSIPVHQVEKNTLSYYTEEAKYDDVIYFTDIDEAQLKISDFKLNRSFNKPWLEDFITNVLIDNDIKINN